MDYPRVSVLIASHNHEAFVEQALDSIAAQDFGDFELIITDDASSDNTVGIIEGWLARTGFPAQTIFNERNHGVCRVRNDALQRARGEFVCFLDADDWSEPDRLSRHVNIFSGQAEDVAFIFGDVRFVDPEGAPLPRPPVDHIVSPLPAPSGKIFVNLLEHNFIPAPAVMVRKKAVHDVGGFDEELFLDDLDMWLRLSQRFDAAYVEGIVANYRILPTSLSHSAQTRGRTNIAILASLAKWKGFSPDSDRLVAKKIRGAALNLRIHGYAREVDAALREVASLAPSFFWDFARVTCRMPGAGHGIRAVRFLQTRSEASARARREHD